MRPFRKKAILLGGDTAALLAFAAIGRSNHGESLDLGSILSVAWPFLAGVLSAALVCITLSFTLVLRAHRQGRNARISSYVLAESAIASCGITPHAMHMRVI